MKVEVEMRKSEREQTEHRTSNFEPPPSVIASLRNLVSFVVKDLRIHLASNALFRAPCKFPK